MSQSLSRQKSKILPPFSKNDGIRNQSAFYTGSERNAPPKFSSDCKEQEPVQKRSDQAMDALQPIMSYGLMDRAQQDQQRVKQRRKQVRVALLAVVTTALTGCFLRMNGAVNKAIPNTTIHGFSPNLPISSTTMRRSSRMTTFMENTVATIPPLPLLRGGSATTISAGSIHMFQRSPLTLLSHFPKHLPPLKRIIQAIILGWCFVSCIQWIQVRQRQKVDPTSEWNRYSVHPGARGRAILALLLEQALWIVGSKTVGQYIPSVRTNCRRRAGKRFAQSVLKLGPLYIKLGQILSCRPNLLGPEWIQAMEALLQDKVPAKSGKEALELAYSSMKTNTTGIVQTDSTTIETSPTKDDDADDSKAQENLVIDAMISSLPLASSTLSTFTPQQKEQFESMFLEFDSKPLAAASLGQVHKAVLRGPEPYHGDVVAVKIQRPFLRQIYNQDLKLLMTIANTMDKLPTKSKNVGGVSSSWTKIFLDAKDILLREIDYEQEAAHAIRFADDFGLDKGGKPKQQTRKRPEGRQASSATETNQDSQRPLLPSAAEWIRTPYVYKDLSSERLLVMEFVPSIKITNAKKLDDANVTALDRLDLADSLARAYLRQFCSTRFFSTDPHPGNLGVELVNGMGDVKPRPRLVMYDFGQAATLTRGQADGILDIIEAIIDMDVDKSMAAFVKMGVLSTTDESDLAKVRTKIAENYRTGKVKANRKKLQRKGYQMKSLPSSSSESSGPNNKDESNNSTTTSGDGNPTNASSKDMEVMSYFTLPAEYAFVARAISQMDGVGKALDPEFDFISNAAPYIVEIKGAERYLQDEFQKRLERLVRSMETAWNNFVSSFSSSNSTSITQTNRTKTNSSTNNTTINTPTNLVAS